MADSLPSTKGITLHQMEVFEAVARNGSYTKAAAELFLTQPTVSIQVKQLAKIVGLPLIESRGRGLVLTPAGETLLTTCRRVLSKLATLDRSLAAFQGLETGIVRLAAMESCKGLLIRRLKPFLDRYPGLDVALHLGSHSELLARLQDNRDDFYIVGGPPEGEAVITWPWLTCPLRVVAPRPHPLAQQTTVTPAQLVQERWVLKEAGESARQQVEAFLSAQGVPLRISLELGNDDVIKASVRAGLGLAVLPESSLSAQDLAQDLAVLSVVGFEAESQWCVAALRGKQFSPPAQTFLDYLLGQALAPQTQHPQAVS